MTLVYKPIQNNITNILKIPLLKKFDFQFFFKIIIYFKKYYTKQIDTIHTYNFFTKYVEITCTCNYLLPIIRFV